MARGGMEKLVEACDVAREAVETRSLGACSH